MREAKREGIIEFIPEFEPFKRNGKRQDILSSKELSALFPYDEQELIRIWTRPENKGDIVPRHHPGGDADDRRGYPVPFVHPVSDPAAGHSGGAGAVDDRESGGAGSAEGASDRREEEQGEQTE